MLAKEPDERQSSMAGVIEQLIQCGVNSAGSTSPCSSKTSPAQETQSVATDDRTDTSTSEPSQIRLERSVVTPQERRAAQRSAVTGLSVPVVRDLPWLPLAVGLGVLGIVGESRFKGNCYGHRDNSGSSMILRR
jgi:hypothetical protein